jgi:large subunit ribosomal protein L35e
LISAVQSKLRELYAKDKYAPLDLRTKGTRAWRRKLSKEDAARKTEKAQKKQSYFPIRMYALKA